MDNLNLKKWNRFTNIVICLTYKQKVNINVLDYCTCTVLNYILFFLFRSTVPTVGAEKMVEGNGVSLTRLLRNANLSLIEFFDKAKKWADMTNLSHELVEKIEKLKRNFSTSHVIFKKYQPIFSDLFKVSKKIYKKK